MKRIHFKLKTKYLSALAIDLNLNFAVWNVKKIHPLLKAVMLSRISILDTTHKLPILLCGKCMSCKMWAGGPHPAFTAPLSHQFLPPRRSTRLAQERERKPGKAWCLASPPSASISSPLWFKFNRWERQPDTAGTPAAIKAACYLHIISQSITLTSQGASALRELILGLRRCTFSVCSALRHADWAILEWYDIPLLQDDVLGHLSEVVRRHLLFWAREKSRRKVNYEMGMVLVDFNRGRLKKVLVGERYNWAGNLLPLMYHTLTIGVSHPKTVCLNCSKWRKQMFGLVSFIPLFGVTASANRSNRIFVSVGTETPIWTYSLNILSLLSSHYTTKDMKNIWPLTIGWLELCVWACEHVGIFVCDWCLYTVGALRRVNSKRLNIVDWTLAELEQTAEQVEKYSLLYSLT